MWKHGGRQQILVRRREEECVFCGEGKDSIEYLIKYSILSFLYYLFSDNTTNEWLRSLGRNAEERVREIRNDKLGKEKERVIGRLWEENRKREKEKTKDKENLKLE